MRYEYDVIDDYEGNPNATYEGEPGPVRRIWPVLAICAGAIVALALGTALSASGLFSAERGAETFVLERADYVKSASAQAVAHVPVAGEVTAAASGTVAEVTVTVGQAVSQGEVIARLEGAGDETQIQSAQQALDDATAQRDAASAAATAAAETSRQAQAAYESAKAGYTQALAAAGSQASRLPQRPQFIQDCASAAQSARQSADSATAVLQAAQARLDAAQQALEATSASNEALIIKSPASGIVTSLDVSVGDVVDAAAGKVLAVIGNYESATLTASLDAPAQDVGAGSLATMTVDGARYTLQVSEAKPTVRGCDVTIPLSGAAGLCADGDRVDISVELAKRTDTYVIPAGSMRLEGDSGIGYVQAIGEDGSPRVVVVEVIEEPDGVTAVIASADLSDGTVIDASYGS